tara:strand:+ start:2207 stop:2653 length:447 start_codon:yes stop_codon:yes gene_type:complete
MVDPITGITAAYAAVQTGIKMGKEITSLGKDLGVLFDFIDNAKSDHAKKKRGSANEEALSTFIEKKQAEDMEENLRNIVIQTRGVGAWHELVKLRADIRVQRKKEEEERIKRRNKLIEDIGFYVLTGLAVLIVTGFGVLAILHFQGRL